MGRTDGGCRAVNLPFYRFPLPHPSFAYLLSVCLFIVSPISLLICCFFRSLVYLSVWSPTVEMVMVIATDRSCVAAVTAVYAFPSEITPTTLRREYPQTHLLQPLTGSGGWKPCWLGARVATCKQGEGSANNNGIERPALNQWPNDRC